MADIFLSYARADAEVAERLANRLTELGWSVFWDRSIAAGSLWAEVVERELGSSKCIVALWSKTSVKSHWVKTEANFGLRAGTLVPASLDGTESPLAFQLVEAAQLRDWIADPSHPEFLVLTAGISRFVAPTARITTPHDADVRPATNVARRPAVSVGRATRLVRAVGITVVSALLLLAFWGMFEAGQHIAERATDDPPKNKVDMATTAVSDQKPPGVPDNVPQPSGGVQDPPSEPPTANRQSGPATAGRKSPQPQPPQGRAGRRGEERNAPTTPTTGSEPKPLDGSANDPPPSGGAASDKPSEAPTPKGDGALGSAPVPGRITQPPPQVGNGGSAEDHGKQEAEDRAQIQSVVFTFRDAYNARDLGLMRSVYRAAPDNIFQANGSCSKVTLAFEGPLRIRFDSRVQAEVSADSTLTCQRATAQRKAEVPKVTDVFKMTRDQGRWTISTWLTPVR